MPFDSTVVIGEGWSRHHAAAAAGGMNATVTVGIPDGEPQYDPETDDTRQPYTTDYDGPARIQAVGSERVADVAGQPVHGRLYLVQLDMEHPGADHPNVVLPGARVKVATAVNDARLVGRDLWVIDPQLGSERFTRDLICSDNQTDVPSA
jgi:hypothetical protein